MVSKGEKMKTHSLIVTSFPNNESAEKIIEILLNKKAAACIHSFPVKSSYIWNNEIVKDSEVVLHIKSLSEKYDKLINVVNSMFTAVEKFSAEPVVTKIDEKEITVNNNYINKQNKSLKYFEK